MPAKDKPSYWVERHAHPQNGYLIRNSRRVVAQGMSQRDANRIVHLLNMDQMATRMLRERNQLLRVTAEQRAASCNQRQKGK